jgi:hypothetical protein
VVARTRVARVDEHLPADQRRASHADRERVADRLRDAAGDGRLTLEELEERLDAAFAARTYRDLDRLLVDLPESDGLVPARAPSPLARGAAVPERVTGQEGRRWSVAVMSGCTRRGRWAVGDDHAAVAVMGGVDLDLREAQLQSRQVVVRAFALMGGIDIVVPDDCEMDVSGVGLMGGFDHHDKAGPPPVDAPVVVVRGLALMGGVTVVRRPRRAPGALGASEPRELDR